MFYTGENPPRAGSWTSGCVRRGQLASRAARLYGSASGEVAPLTGLQREQQAYYRRMLGELHREAGALRVP
jgi:hypothetical protein